MHTSYAYESTSTLVLATVSILLIMHVYSTSLVGFHDTSRSA